MRAASEWRTARDLRNVVAYLEREDRAQTVFRSFEVGQHSTSDRLAGTGDLRAEAGTKLEPRCMAALTEIVTEGAELAPEAPAV